MTDSKYVWSCIPEAENFKRRIHEIQMEELETIVIDAFDSATTLKFSVPITDTEFDEDVIDAIKEIVKAKGYTVTEPADSVNLFDVEANKR